MESGYWDIPAEQYATFDQPVTILDETGGLVDLTGCTAKMEIRPAIGEDPIHTLTELSGLTLGGVLGTIEIVFLPTVSGEYVYDLLVTFPDGHTERELEGKVTIDPGVTEP